MNIKRVDISNFKSLKELSLELGNYTVILGKSDQGKTAFVEAVQSALSNVRGAKKIRDGASSLVVTLFFGGMDYLLFTKGKSSRFDLCIGGAPKRYDKMGSLIPDELKEIVRPWEVEGAKSVLPQVKTQHEPHFILGESSTVSKRLDSIEGRIYQQAVTQCESSIRRMKKELTAGQKDLKYWEERKESLTGLVLDLSQSWKVVLGNLRKVSLILVAACTDKVRSGEQVREIVEAYVQYKATLDLQDLAYYFEHLGHIVEVMDYLIRKYEIASAEMSLLALQRKKTLLDKKVFESGYCPLCERPFDGCIDHK